MRSHSLIKAYRHYVQDETAAALIEYTLIMAILSFTTIVSMRLLGVELGDIFGYFQKVMQCTLNNQSDNCANVS